MKKIDSLNLIPFIDIMLVLLVIVLTSASFVAQSRIQVDVPRIEENSGKSADKKSMHSISIDKNGRIYLDDKNMSLEGLKAQIEGFEKETQIIIRGDRQSDLELFLEITTMLRDEGIHDVYVTTQKK